MDRAEFLKTFAETLPLGAFWVIQDVGEQGNRIDIKEGTIIASFRHEGKVYALGIELEYNRDKDFKILECLLKSVKSTYDMLTKQGAWDV